MKVEKKVSTISECKLNFKQDARCKYLVIHTFRLEYYNYNICSMYNYLVSK